jgi:hypothetical protein
VYRVERKRPNTKDKDKTPTMASQLHARKSKALPLEISDLTPTSPHSGAFLKGKRSIKKLPKELLWAVTAVGGFLGFGLFLGYVLLHHQHRQIILHVMKDPWGHGGAILQGRAGFRHHFYTGSPRYVTVVMPSVVKPEGRTKRLESIQDTWGQYARAMYVVHNVTEFPEAAHAVVSDVSLPTDPYSYPQLLLLPSEIGVDDGLQRLYKTIRTVFEKVNPDFAFFVNDHTFVIPEHLCKYLEHRDPADDLYAGHALKNGKEQDVFNSGAAGYLLSRGTMAKLIGRWDGEDPTCLMTSEATKWLSGNPGLATVRCLKSIGITAIDTRASHKWHRFHAFPLTRVVSGEVDEWYIKKHVDVGQMIGEEDDSYSTLLPGEDCCSMDTISFHYVEYMEARALFATREAVLKNPQMSDQELKDFMLKEWPKDRAEIGFYSAGLPKAKDEEKWTPLLQVVRKISTRRTQRDC